MQVEVEEGKGKKMTLPKEGQQVEESEAEESSSDTSSEGGKEEGQQVIVQPLGVMMEGENKNKTATTAAPAAAAAPDQSQHKDDCDGSSSDDSDTTSEGSTEDEKETGTAANPTQADKSEKEDETQESSEDDSDTTSDGHEGNEQPVLAEATGISGDNASEDDDQESVRQENEPSEGEKEDKAGADSVSDSEASEPTCQKELAVEKQYEQPSPVDLLSKFNSTETKPDSDGNDTSSDDSSTESNSSDGNSNDDNTRPSATHHDNTAEGAQDVEMVADATSSDSSDDVDMTSEQKTKEEQSQETMTSKVDAEPETCQASSDESSTDSMASADMNNTHEKHEAKAAGRPSAAAVGFSTQHLTDQEIQNKLNGVAGDKMPRPKRKIIKRKATAGKKGRKLYKPQVDEEESSSAAEPPTLPGSKSSDSTSPSSSSSSTSSSSNSDNDKTGEAWERGMHMLKMAKQCCSPCKIREEYPRTNLKRWSTTGQKYPIYPEELSSRQAREMAIKRLEAKKQLELKDCIKIPEAAVEKTWTSVKAPHEAGDLPVPTHRRRTKSFSYLVQIPEF